MKWHKCSEQMPGIQYDVSYVDQPMYYEPIRPIFLVVYHHGDNDPFICKALLNKGKFIIDEHCNFYDEEKDEECRDPYQEEYWKRYIVTHWALIEWPNEFYE